MQAEATPDQQRACRSWRNARTGVEAWRRFRDWLSRARPDDAGDAPWWAADVYSSLHFWTGAKARSLVLFQKGRGVPQDSGRARSLYESACSHGQPSACTNLGVMQLRGMVGPADAVAAAKAFSASCDQGEPGGCLNLGMLYEAGNGVPHDATRAHDLYDRACRAGLEDACKAASAPP